MLTLLAVCGCGYQPVYGRQSSQPITVVVGQVVVPEPIAVQAALSAARSALATAGLLMQGATFPRLVIDVLRVDEGSRGVHVVAGQPRAGAMSVAVTVRARMVGAEGLEAGWDSGDVRRAVQMTGNVDPAADSANYDLALRSAAERAGTAVTRAALGIPEASDETP